MFTDPSGEKFKDWLKERAVDAFMIVVGTVIIVYSAACIGAGLTYGIALGELMGPQMAIIGGLVGAQIGRAHV